MHKTSGVAVAGRGLSVLGDGVGVLALGAAVELFGALVEQDVAINNWPNTKSTVDARVHTTGGFDISVSFGEWYSPVI
jgi:hypothetical protein